VVTLQGGTCSDSKGVITVNAGLAVGPDWAGRAVPDYATLDVPDLGGRVPRLEVWVNGVHTVAATARATVGASKKVLHVTGTTVQDVAFTVDIAC
jgi:hypothetical protein